jgi:hypothetical protein
METGPTHFSRETLQKFEDASASIPLRALDRAFERAGVRLGEDPGDGLGGSRRTQFRRYVAAVNRQDPREVDRLAHALGALMADVAESKHGFLTQAAERDGFSFADGVFRAAASASTPTRVEDLASIDERATRLRLLARDRPEVALDGARELIDSVCRLVLRDLGEPAPEDAIGLVDLAAAVFAALEEPAPAGSDEARGSAAVVRTCLEPFVAVVVRLGERPAVGPRYARLAVGAAVTFALFIAETYDERAR